jgi:hypothetical protein
MAAQPDVDGTVWECTLLAKLPWISELIPAEEILTVIEALRLTETWM